MNIYTRLIGFAAVAATTFCSSPCRAETEPPLRFEEVFKLVRTNLAGIPEAELSRLAAEGLLKELGSKVQLVTGTSANNLQEKAGTVTKKALYNDNYGYVRLGAVGAGAAGQFQEAHASLQSSNRLKGVVLDLRYAGGQDYEAAAALADLFVAEGRTLLKLDGKELRSKGRSDAITLPLAVLVNRQTRGAAEALAAVLRDAQAGLIIGSPTAGEARMYETFELSTGQQLRLGTIPVLLGSGEPIPATGIRPDIQVNVASEAEKAFFEDPYRSASSLQAGGESSLSTNEGGTNRSRRFSEADLVRRHRETLGPDTEEDALLPALVETEPDLRVINDPVLARGLDFLKGIAVLQSFRSTP